ncbi:hypothetical protein [Halomicrobium salinisoli]|uniref:hypothetical protein n=1 Tax=Halomicrobium salinisoli TaxID=2878391 RepID=UPI001CF0A870|nr:hypothetical protein [Halomicrobium salinisoli]
MRRRALLASLAGGAVALSGCSVLSSRSDDRSTVTPAPVPDETGDGSAPNGTDTDDPTTDDATPGNEWLIDPTRVVELETGPRTVALHSGSFHTHDAGTVVLAFDRTATADHPARLRGYLENGNDFEHTFHTEEIPGVGAVHADPVGRGDGSLHLVPTEHNDLAETVPDVTRSGGYWSLEGPRDVGPWMAETYRMDPGERALLEYHLVGEPWATGAYEFSGDEAVLRAGVWNADSPGPDGDSRFDGRSVPSIGSGEDEMTVTWYHEADADTRAFVRPSTERLELNGRAEFEAINHSPEELRCGHWYLHKLVDGEWFFVGPASHTADCRALTPGDRKQWVLRAYGGEAVSSDEHATHTAGYLGGGTYGVVAGYGLETDNSGALVELVGDSVEVVPTDGASAERDDGAVTVTTEWYDEAEPSERDRLVLTRAEEAGERLIAEVVMRERNRALRNALARAADDVDRVVVRTVEHAVDDAVGYDSDRRRFRFRGRAYEARRSAGED